MSEVNNLPEHIAFIMDGNGRWAKKRGLSRTKGHIAGVEAMKNIIASCKDRIRILSFYAFSKQNWSRPKEEVDALFAIIQKFLEKESDKVINSNVALKFIGDLDNLPKKIGDKCKEINKLVVKAATTVCIYINYGGQEDIINACNKLISLDKQNITEKELLDNLYTRGLPPPDLVIRTGGEKRLSNFMLFQIAYSELLFTDCYWPDFDNIQLEKTLVEFGNRIRRFGA